MENEVDFEDINPFFKVEQQVSQDKPNVSLQIEEDKHLDAKILHLTQQNEALKRNISCLYKTARLEIQKCEHKLHSLQEELSCRTNVNTCHVYTQTPPQSNNITSSSSSRERRREREDARRVAAADKSSSCNRHKERHSIGRERKKRLLSSPTRKDSHRKHLDNINNKLTKKRKTSSSLESKKSSKRTKTAKLTKKSTKHNQQNITNTSDLEEGEIVSSDDN